MNPLGSAHLFEKPYACAAYVTKKVQTNPVLLWLSVY